MIESIATEDYEFIRQLVYEHSRINLGPDKMELVRSRVQKRLRALGLDDFESYCRLLESSSGEEELTSLLDVISTNVTHFFREWEHFQFLQSTSLPGYCTGKKASGREPLRAWSAACSSGQEPYSLAIVFADFFGQQPDRAWRITATDISTRMLEIARQGIYPGNQVKLPAPDWLSAYFQKGSGSWEGHDRVKSSLRQRVEFRHLNLFDWPYPWTEKFHIIFCRNVMIYFDRQTQEQLVSRLTGQLEPEGYLFVGHSESLVGIDHDLKSLRPSIYQKPKIRNGPSSMSP
jgi:chemotaxis protein methyltransferase CheR